MLDELLYKSGQQIMNLYTKAMLDLDVVWHAPLPDGPKIIAPNHPTTTDPFFMTALIPEPIKILVTGAAFDVPVFGRYLRGVGHVPVVKENGRAALNEAQQLLAEGRTLAIFPEGALSPRNGGMHRPRTGAARLALGAGVPVVPVGIHLDRSRVRFVEPEIDGQIENGRLYLRGPYAVTVGKPIHFQGDAGNHDYVRLVSERIMDHILQLSHESAYRLNRSGLFVPAAEAGAARLAGAG